MKYGKNEVTRKLKKTTSKADKITNKFLLLMVKSLLIMIAFVCVFGISLGYMSLIINIPLAIQYRTQRFCHYGL